MQIIHHGALNGVTGSCHELVDDSGAGILVDCGLFQGAETSGSGADCDRLEIEFPIDHIRALVVTHVHIDHVGRIPYLLAAGFKGPIYCSEPSAKLLPLVMEDAIKMGFTRRRELVDRVVAAIKRKIQPVPYGLWRRVDSPSESSVEIRLQPAGHILGSAYVEARVSTENGVRKVIFSGDLGAPYSPMLVAPKSPYGADVVVLESTYGDRLHEGRRARRTRLRAVIERALKDRGVVLIPAFSIGRTQELLYELESLIFENRDRPILRDLPWRELEVVLDSPLASRFTRVYRELAAYWDREAQKRVRLNRKPLDFDQITTVNSHRDHEAAVEYLRRTARPCIVIAASGMCAGGRVVNYLKALLGDERTDIVFVGYQAMGTPGRAIQQYGPNHGYVELDGQRYDIRAKVHTLSGYSAHADGKNLLDFVRRMRRSPKEVRLVHGDPEAKEALKRALLAFDAEMKVVIPR